MVLFPRKEDVEQDLSAMICEEASMRSKIYNREDLKSVPDHSLRSMAVGWVSH